uniref:POC1 centriolar protein A n=1 Tax=Amphiprion ocellaris TaxID=80972 RepID=A0AAQ5X0C6_AMPOC
CVRPSSQFRFVSGISLSPTWSCSFHSSGRFLASCSSDRTAKLWDLNSQRCRLTLRRHDASVNSVHFLSSSNLLLTASADKTVVLWDTRLAVCPAVFTGHRHPSNQVVFSQSGKALAVASGDGSVRLVELESCEAISLDGHNGSVQSVKFDHKGTTVMSAGSDGRINKIYSNKTLEALSLSVNSQEILQFHVNKRNPFTKICVPNYVDKTRSRTKSKTRSRTKFKTKYRTRSKTKSKTQAWQQQILI